MTAPEAAQWGLRDRPRLSHSALPELDRCLEEYLFNIYPSQPQGVLGGTPLERFTPGLELTGNRHHREVPYDQKFFLLSLPPSRRGVATVDRRKGITA